MAWEVKMHQVGGQTEGSGEKQRGLICLKTCLKNYVALNPCNCSQRRFRDASERQHRAPWVGVGRHHCQKLVCSTQFTLSLILTFLTTSCEHDQDFA